MGDGQHIWASAEWVMMIRNCFVREEGNRLILFAGVPTDWLHGDRPIRFGPAHTALGPITLIWDPTEASVVQCRAHWRGKPPDIQMAHGLQHDILANC